MMNKLFLLLFLAQSACTTIQPSPDRPNLVECQNTLQVYANSVFEDGNTVLVISPREAHRMIEWSQSLVDCYLSNMATLIDHIAKLEKQVKDIQ